MNCFAPLAANGAKHSNPEAANNNESKGKKMSLEGTYTSGSTATLKVTTASKGRIEGAMTALVENRQREFRVGGNYHYVNGHSSRTILYLNAVHKGTTQDGKKVQAYVNLAGTATSKTPDTLTVQGGHAFVSPTDRIVAESPIKTLIRDPG